MTREPQEPRADDGDHAIRDFSRELAQAYEQISFLYRLGRSMNWLTRPADFVETACNLLLEMLEFRWIAVRHAAADPAPPELAGVLTCAGTPPCPIAALDDAARGLLESISSDDWSKLLEPGRDALADLVGAQVVAEPVISGGELAAVLLAGNKASGDPDVTSVETQLLDATADYLGAFLNSVGLFEEQREMFLGTVRALTAAIDAKDPYTRGHSERVAHLGRRLALATGMTEDEAERVHVAGLVHDIGKIGVPEAVLCKPGRLTDEEFEQIRRHPGIGHRILRDIRPMHDVLPGVLHHHERWDGRGYPEGLAGEAIPLLGRLLAVADAFDAMSSNRAYRSALTRAKVLQEIRNGSGTQFDPALAAAFAGIDLREFDAMVAEHVEREAA